MYRNRCSLTGNHNYPSLCQGMQEAYGRLAVFLYVGGIIASHLTSPTLLSRSARSFFKSDASLVMSHDVGVGTLQHHCSIPASSSSPSTVPSASVPRVRQSFTSSPFSARHTSSSHAEINTSSTTCIRTAPATTKTVLSSRPRRSTHAPPRATVARHPPISQDWRRDAPIRQRWQYRAVDVVPNYESRIL